MKENISKNTLKNILICGIGGQGVVLAGKIISLAALSAEFDVKTSEVHGMSQRGGSVSTHVRYGNKIFSPLIPEKSSDILLSFDIFETLMFAKIYADKYTAIISSGTGKFPAWNDKNKPVSISEIISVLKKNYPYSHFINSSKMSEEIGGPKISNMILIGFMSNFTDIKEDIWLKTINKNMPEKITGINIKAFLAGKNEFNKLNFSLNLLNNYPAHANCKLNLNF